MENIQTADENGKICNFKENVKYPTWYQKIGKISCFFIKNYKNGQIPICSIGPSLCPSFILFIIVIFMTATFISFLVQTTVKFRNQKSNDDLIYLAERYILIFLFGLSISVNILFYLKTVLGDPGVPESVYVYYSQLNEPCKEDANAKNISDTLFS